MLGVIFHVLLNVPSNFANGSLVLCFSTFTDRLQFNLELGRLVRVQTWVALVFLFFAGKSSTPTAPPVTPATGTPTSVSPAAPPAKRVSSPWSAADYDYVPSGTPLELPLSVPLPSSATVGFVPLPPSAHFVENEAATVSSYPQSRPTFFYRLWFF